MEQPIEEADGRASDALATAEIAILLHAAAMHERSTVNHLVQLADEYGDYNDFQFVEALHKDIEAKVEKVTDDLTTEREWLGRITDDPTAFSRLNNSLAQSGKTAEPTFSTNLSDTVGFLVEARVAAGRALLALQQCSLEIDWDKNTWVGTAMLAEIEDVRRNLSQLRDRAYRLR